MQVLLEFLGAGVVKGPGQFLIEAGKGLLKAPRRAEAHGPGVMGAGRWGGLGRGLEMFQGLRDLSPGEVLHALAEAGQGRGGAAVQGQGYRPPPGRNFSRD